MSIIKVFHGTTTLSEFNLLIVFSSLSLSASHHSIYLEVLACLVHNSLEPEHLRFSGNISRIAGRQAVGDKRGSLRGEGQTQRRQAFYPIRSPQRKKKVYLYQVAPWRPKVSLHKWRWFTHNQGSRVGISNDTQVLESQAKLDTELPCIEDEASWE